MWLCHHPHGSVLVYRVHAASCDRLAAGCPLPYDGHHAGWSGTVNMYFYTLYVSCTLLSGNAFFVYMTITVR